jgi:hypothetical protein
LLANSSASFSNPLINTAGSWKWLSQPYVLYHNPE